MLRVLVVGLAFLFQVSAIAGGIGFKEKYEGKHPISGNDIALEFGSEGITLAVKDSIANAEKGQLSVISRDSFETIFKLVGETPGGPLTARIVTTGDCQIVQHLRLIFPSGVSTTLRATR